MGNPVLRAIHQSREMTILTKLSLLIMVFPVRRAQAAKVATADKADKLVNPVRLVRVVRVVLAATAVMAVMVAQVARVVQVVMVQRPFVVVPVFPPVRSRLSRQVMNLVVMAAVMNPATAKAMGKAMVRNPATLRRKSVPVNLLERHQIIVIPPPNLTATLN